MAHIYESYHTHEYVLSRAPVASVPHDKYVVMSHVGMSHVAHSNESCHICMSHVTHPNTACLARPLHQLPMTSMCVMSHVGMSHLAHMNVMSYMYKSCHTHEHGMSRVPVASAPHDKYMSHVAHANEPCRT